MEFFLPVFVDDEFETIFSVSAYLSQRVVCSDDESQSHDETIDDSGDMDVSRVLRWRRHSCITWHVS